MTDLTNNELFAIVTNWVNCQEIQNLKLVLSSIDVSFTVLNSVKLKADTSIGQLIIKLHCDNTLSNRSKILTINLKGSKYGKERFKLIESPNYPYNDQVNCIVTGYLKKILSDTTNTNTNHFSPTNLEKLKKDIQEQVGKSSFAREINNISLHQTINGKL